MVNCNKLKGTMVEHSITASEMAAVLGINRATLSRKINGESSFTIDEADTIVKHMNLSAQEAQAIFFSQFVA